MGYKNGLAIFASALMFATPAMSELVIVTPEASLGWIFHEESSNGSGELRPSIDTPPLGEGSARLMVDANGRMLFGTLLHIGVRLDEIQFLEYNTWQDPLSIASEELAITLQFDMDYDLTDSINSWQGRMVFEPSKNPDMNVVSKGVWQTWNPHLGKWWMTTTPVVGNTPQLIPFHAGNPGTWDEVLTFFPNAGIRAAVLFRAGPKWSGFDGDVDAFVITVNYEVTTYDFDVLEIAEPDTDGDGIPDSEDIWPESDMSPTIVIGGYDTGVTNVLTEDGLTLIDWLLMARAEFSQHGKFMTFVTSLTNAWAADGLIQTKDKGKIKSAAAKFR